MVGRGPSGVVFTRPVPDESGLGLKMKTAIAGRGGGPEVDGHIIDGWCSGSTPVRARVRESAVSPGKVLG